MDRHVVLGFDGSPGSHAALQVAVQLATAFSAPLAVVFGYEPNPQGGESADYRHKLEARGSEVVGAALDEVRRLAPGLVVEPLVVPLRPVNSLVEAATERQALFVVVGGTGEHPIVGAVLGSVPSKLLHLSAVPVVVVPAVGD